MRSHLRQTTASYDSIASQYLEETRHFGLDLEWLASFAEALPTSAPVLDLGSGPGRDAAALRKLGLQAICVDLSIGMLRAGLSEYPNSRVQGDLLPISITHSNRPGFRSRSPRNTNRPGIRGSYANVSPRPSSACHMAGSPGV